MHCEKCSGRMSYEGFYGSDSGSVWYYPGWRCVHCGDIVDSVVRLNRNLNGTIHLNGNGDGEGKSVRVRNKKKSGVNFDLDNYSVDPQYASALDEW